MGQGLSTKAKTYGIDGYDFVRADILEGLMRPGMRLKIQHFCALHDVRNGAVREALSLLKSEGRVELEPQRPYSVSRVTQEELLDLSDARIQFETLCINLTKENRFIDWEAEIIASHYRLSSIAECDPSDPYRLNDGWSVLHAHFHVALAAARAVKHLLRMRAQLFEQCERYRRLFVPLRYVNRDVELEHLKIKDAVLTVDCANMSTLMHEHQATATQIIINLSISNYGDGKICLER